MPCVDGLDVDTPCSRVGYRFAPHRASGFTLVELVIVLLVMAALAGMMIPMIASFRSIDTPTGKKSAEQIATESTLNRIRNAILGNNSVAGYWSDMAHRRATFPVNLSPLFIQPGSVPHYNPVTQIGWRGPYLHSTGQDASGNPTMIDAWGNPILLQADFDGDGTVGELELPFVRLVSLGEDEILQATATPQNMMPGADASTQLTLTESGDDVVMFLRTADTRR
ncbi:MAG: prepilin-type N-terminal cleavage/methylation domain-containing protein [Pirellulales bacterium]|nr:prepilin-type N-terminal cleavage/methylation domain-containing protein [Pirellulales bacterium]